MTEKNKTSIREDVAIYVDPKKRMPLVVTIMVSLIGAAMFGYGLATAMMSIGESVNGLAMVAWLFTASNIVQMVMNPLIPALSNKIGLPKLVLIGIIVQAAVLALFSIVGNMTILIILRVFQGFAGSALFAGGLALAAQIVPPEKRATVTGLQMAFNGVGSMLGPVLAGAACDMGNWRIWTWISLIPVVVALVFYIIFYPKDVAPVAAKEEKSDVKGALIILVMFIALALLLQMSGTYWAWISPVTLVLAVIVVISVVLFVKTELLVEKQGRRPAFRISLFKKKVFVIPAICAMTVCVATNGIATYAPSYGQSVLGLTATQSGMGYSIGSVFVVIVSLCNGFVFGKKRWFKACNTIGCFAGIVVAALMLMSNIMSAGLFTGLIAFYTTWTAWISAVNFTIVQMCLPTDDVVDATAGVTATQMIGAFLGVSLNTAIINIAGYSGLFVGCIVAFAITIIIMLFLRDPKKSN